MNGSFVAEILVGKLVQTLKQFFMNESRSLDGENMKHHEVLSTYFDSWWGTKLFVPSRAVRNVPKFGQHEQHSG